MVKISLNTGVKTVIIKNIWLCHFFLITLASLLASSLWKYIFSKSRLQGLTKNKPIFRLLTQAFPQNFYDYLSSSVLPIAYNVPRLSTSARLVTIRLQFKNNFQYSPIFSDRHYFRAFCLTDVVRSGLLMKFDYSYLNILILLVCTT